MPLSINGTTLDKLYINGSEMDKGYINGTEVFSGFDPLTDHPAAFGAAYGGGFYAGKVTKSDGIYAIIVSPKASGENGGSTIAFKTSQTADAGARSLVDGLANTNSMNDANHPAAQYCRSLSINGYTDWYLPARDELEVCYRNLKPSTSASYDDNDRGDSDIVYSPLDDLVTDHGVNRYSVPEGSAYTTSDPVQTTASAFQTGGSEAFITNFYLSSTEVSDTKSWRHYFNDGYQYSNYKGISNYVRAIRSIKLG
jgi:hypothetical protein